MKKYPVIVLANGRDNDAGVAGTFDMLGGLKTLAGCDVVWPPSVLWGGGGWGGCLKTFVSQKSCGLLQGGVGWGGWGGGV